MIAAIEAVLDSVRTDLAVFVAILETLLVAPWSRLLGFLQDLMAK